MLHKLYKFSAFFFFLLLFNSNLFSQNISSSVDPVEIWRSIAIGSESFNHIKVIRITSLLDSLSTVNFEVSVTRSFPGMIHEIERSVILDNSFMNQIKESNNIHLLFTSYEFKFRTIVAAQISLREIFRSLPEQDKLSNLVLYTTTNYECTRIKTDLLKKVIDNLSDNNSIDTKKRGWNAIESMLSEIDFKKCETGEERLQSGANGIFEKPHNILQTLSLIKDRETDADIKLFASECIKHIQTYSSKEFNDNEDIVKMPYADKYSLDKAISILNILKQADSTKSDIHRIKLFTEVLDMDSTILTAYINRGVSYYKTNLFSNALEDFNKAISIYNSYEIPYAYRGMILLKTGNINAAILDLNKAIKLDPYFHEAYSSRGLAFQKQSEFDKAIDDFTTAIKLDSSSVSNFINRGLCYGQLKNYIAAEKDLITASNKSPENALTWYNLGNVYYLQKNWNQAMESWKKSYELNKNFKDIPEKLESLKLKTEIRQ